MNKIIDKYDDMLKAKGYNKSFHIYMDHKGSPGKILKEFIVENQRKIEAGTIQKVTIDSDLKKNKHTGEYVVATFDFEISKKLGLNLNEMGVSYLLGEGAQLDEFIPINSKADILTQSKSIKKAEEMRWGKQGRKRKLKI